MSLDGRTELDSNKKGHLWLKGPAVTRGYWKRPDTTANNLTEDGWLKTGDLAYAREDGKVCVLDRVENVIQTPEGYQVVPFEVEAAIMEIRGVQEAVVVGVKSDANTSTSEPRAFVTIKKGASVTSQDLERELKERRNES
ncbi:hypothetical protein PRZ48_014296 [Zasmidium cellare]|uniref:AMP-binding enzyme C-terminal domain-containing protein n=1 Tax=Zasmidium cellare TaxID=395010 RepID=A0ABR0E0J3_ZASCE|nr:hypothetical protein PRZ48_014296 [Zasmidium cellare]